jgi:hypothetical protein
MDPLESLSLLARFLWWLAWEFLFLTITWSVGWPIVRLLSFGRFPRAGFRGYEESGTGEAFVVCGTGFGVICLLPIHYWW